MADQVLKDNKGHKIGMISTASNGIQTIKDAEGHKKGYKDQLQTKPFKELRGIEATA